MENRVTNATDAEDRIRFKNELKAKVEAFATCSECSKDAHSSGKCITHYQQMRRERKGITAQNAKGKYKN